MEIISNSKNSKIKVAIIGAAGYVAGELIRILVNHPTVELTLLNSNSQDGKNIWEVHKDLYSIDLFSLGQLKFTKYLDLEHIDVLFLCLAHGESVQFLVSNEIPKHIRIIDLSQDFRLTNIDNPTDRIFIYGLPELNFDLIKKAQNIANPGCFATAIQLALLPSIESDLVEKNIFISAATGSTGAGQSLTTTNQFTWRSNNHSAYKTFEHQHLAEINQTLDLINSKNQYDLTFLPQRAAFTRGIFAIINFESDIEIEQFQKTYNEYYKNHPFTHIVPFEVDVKQVVNTNNCYMQIVKVDNKIAIISVIDNLIKGAAGQAIQNMNIMFGLEQSTGLLLKASYF